MDLEELRAKAKKMQKHSENRELHEILCYLKHEFKFGVRRIQKLLKEEYQIEISTSYISTLFLKHKICEKIFEKSGKRTEKTADFKFDESLKKGKKSGKNPEDGYSEKSKKIETEKSVKTKPAQSEAENRQKDNSDLEEDEVLKKCKASLKMYRGDTDVEWKKENGRWYFVDRDGKKIHRYAGRYARIPLHESDLLTLDKEKLDELRKYPSKNGIVLKGMHKGRTLRELEDMINERDENGELTDSAIEALRFLTAVNTATLTAKEMFKDELENYHDNRA